MPRSRHAPRRFEDHFKRSTLSPGFARLTSESRSRHGLRVETGRGDLATGVGSTTRFFLEGVQAIWDKTTGKGAATWRRVPGLGSYHLESTTLGRSAAGGTASLYDAYGRTVWSTGAATPRRWKGAHGYQSERSGMTLLGARFYLPQLGRFLNGDPIGHAGGPDLYAYCDNSPVTRVDPSGKDWTILGFQFSTRGVRNGLWTSKSALLDVFTFGYVRDADAIGEVGYGGATSLATVGREALIGAVTLGTGEAVASYRALRAARAANETVEVLHYTTRAGANAIRAARVINGTQKGLWGPGVYFGSSTSFGGVTRTLFWGLGLRNQAARVGVQVAARDVAWRPFGVRLVRQASLKF